MSGRVRLKCNGLIDEDFPSLMDITMNYIASNLGLFYHLNSKKYEEKNVVRLPIEICDRLLEVYQRRLQNNGDLFYQIFYKENRYTPFRNAKLRNSAITDVGLKLLFQHSLHSLSMWYVENISTQLWTSLSTHCKDLKELELGRDVYLLKHTEPNDKTPIDFQIEFSGLKKLILHSIVLQPSVKFHHLTYLKHLDLSLCIFAEFTLAALLVLPNLTHLILFNVWPLYNEFDTISKLTQLQLLDISLLPSSAQDGFYPTPNETLATLVKALPNLKHLDISGTNLAGNGVAEFPTVDHVRSSDIPGLNSRINNPLFYLGLYGTAFSASRRYDIPAEKIGGDASEEQILTAAIMYQDRPLILTKVLNDLYQLLRYETCRLVHRAVDAVLTAMDKHVKVKHIQISGSATLFYIVKGRDKGSFGKMLKNHMIRTLLNGMSCHMSDDTMMRNCCLTLCQFSIPNDVLFEYERLVCILLHGVGDIEQEGFVQRIAIYLLNALACQVNGLQKLYLGDCGAIGTMLTLIDERLSRKVIDDVMEVAWSTMWNVTDETPTNCKRFLDSNGMKYFLGCLRIFPEKEELLRNMMGLLGNVAEVQSLRTRLMSSEFITVFTNLLHTGGESIEVSYNAAGVLAHIASDGPMVWTISAPSRSSVCDHIVEAINGWDLNAERNINYRSFQPIIGLLQCYHTPACQHWAVWALANLTRVYPAKYCILIANEGGLQILQHIAKSSISNDSIKELASAVIENCNQSEENSRMVLECD